jgi:hypothetical protein
MKTTILLSIMLGLFTMNAQAQEKLDTSQVMKANVIPIIAIPAELGSASNYQEELLEAYVRLHVVYTGEVGFDLFRWGDWFGGLYWTFNDVRTGPLKIKIFLNDTFTASFSDGTTIDFKFMGIYAPSGLMFQVVPGSERTASGEPIAARPRMRFDGSGYYAWEATWWTFHSWSIGGISHARNQR